MQQLNEFSTNFLSNYNIFRCMIGSELTCCFKKSIGLTNSDTNNRRKRDISLSTKIKNKIKCPFKMTFSKKNYKYSKKTSYILQSTN